MNNHHATTDVRPPDVATDALAALTAWGDRLAKATAPLVVASVDQDSARRALDDLIDAAMAHNRQQGLGLLLQTAYDRPLTDAQVALVDDLLQRVVLPAAAAYDGEQ